MAESENCQSFFQENPLPFSWVDIIKPDSKENLEKQPQLKYFVSGYAAKLIRSVLGASGFTATSDMSQSILIVGSALESPEFLGVDSFQRTNHYLFTFDLGSKDGYHHLMQNLARRIGSFPSFYPESYFLPNEKKELAEVFSTSKYWIMKPAGGSRGEGISLIHVMPKLSIGKRVIVQRYIPNPLLINGLKFDLRFYVSVMSLDPLRIYLFNNGLVRLATSPYKDNLETPKNIEAHLTNFSITIGKCRISNRCSTIWNCYTC